MLLAEEEMVTEGITSGFTVMVMMLLTLEAEQCAGSAVILTLIC